MSDESKRKSTKELLDIAVKIIRDNQPLLDKILGQTPNEIQEMHKILEGLTSREIRDALITYRGRQPLVRVQPLDMETQELNELLKGFAPWEAIRALRNYRISHPKRED